MFGFFPSGGGVRKERTSIVEADAGRRPDAASVVKALSGVDHFEFDKTGKRPTYERGGGTKALLHLTFQCSLDESKAVCPAS
jgi:hypothetical protein